jgi:hypothetical protein
MTAEQLEGMLRSLPPAEKIRLIEILARQILEQNSTTTQRPCPSLLGLCKDLAPAPSADEIDQARKEMVASFPREDLP